MAEAIVIQSGNSIDYTPTSNTDAGDVVVFGTIPTVACGDITANTLGALYTSGVFDVTKGSSAFITGAAVYWDNSANEATSSSGGNTEMGVAVNIVASGASLVRVLFTQGG